MVKKMDNRIPNIFTESPKILLIPNVKYIYSIGIWYTYTNTKDNKDRLLSIEIL